MAEGVDDREALVLLAVVEVFGIEAGAASGEGGGDDQGIVEAIAVAILEVEGALVKGGSWNHLPERLEDATEQFTGVPERNGRGEFPGEDVEGFLDNLKADD